MVIGDGIEPPSTGFQAATLPIELTDLLVGLRPSPALPAGPANAVAFGEPLAALAALSRSSLELSSVMREMAFVEEERGLDPHTPSGVRTAFEAGPAPCRFFFRSSTCGGRKRSRAPHPFGVRTAFKAGLATSPVFLPTSLRWSVRESNPLRRDLQSLALPNELTDQRCINGYKLEWWTSRESHPVTLFARQSTHLRDKPEFVVVRVSGALWFASLKQPSVQRILRVGPRTMDDNGGRQRTRTSRSCPRESRSRRSSLPANLPSVDTCSRKSGARQPARSVVRREKGGQDGGIRTCDLQSPRLALLPG